MKASYKARQFTFSMSLAEIAIGFLVVLAVVLGIFLYKKQSIVTKTTVTPTLAPTSTKKSSRVMSGPYYDGLTTDEKLALEVPDVNASDDEKRKHFEATLRAAKSADFLDITNCMSTPVVMKIKENEMFTIKNPDSLTRTIIFDATRSITVPALDQITEKASFGRGKGLYAYGCGQSPYATGLFLIE